MKLVIEIPFNTAELRNSETNGYAVAAIMREVPRAFDGLWMEKGTSIDLTVGDKKVGIARVE